MKKLLIIRSVPMQQLDKNLLEIKKSFSGYTIDLLTHEHGAKLAEKYKDISNIIIYPFKQSFKYKHKVKLLQQEGYDAIIIPVTNLSGKGFYNVFLFALTIPAKQRFVCNLVSEIRSLTTLNIVLIALKHFLLSLLSLGLTIPISILLSIILPFKLARLKNRV
ncbi:glycosyltransferase family 9 protein [Bacillus sp. AK128]